MAATRAQMTKIPIWNAPTGLESITSAAFTVLLLIPTPF